VKKVILAIILLVLIGPFVILFLLSSTPQIAFDPPPTVIGAATPVKIRISDPRGARSVAAYLEQNGNRYAVYNSAAPARRFLFWTSKQQPQEHSFAAGTKNAPGLKDGKAALIATATSNDLRGTAATETREVMVVTRPPAVTPDGAQHYINQGGSELVTFAVSGYWTAAGVKSGKYAFRSFALPGSNQRFSLFAYPWDLPPDVAPVVFASNPAGNDVTGHFWFKVFPKKFRKRDLVLDDGFIRKVVDEIDPNGSGDALARFLKINSEVRRQNNKALADLRLKTEERFLWSGPFLRQEAKDESMFADVRSYIYKGKKVDEQVHLGYDLSNVRNTPIQAANDGRVAYADRLGIYGNCIVVDHGYGLQTIYGHLSRIQVKPGDMVKKGQKMGLSGATGMAGGDHLHFSMQVDGVQVDPKEWWDEHWIHDRILSKIHPSGTN
jgi:murein DD-endopeptidase MepM/ murein hydrolase activator NlpD